MTITCYSLHGLDGNIVIVIEYTRVMAPSLWRFIPRLLERDGDRCMICRQPLDFAVKVPHPRAVTVDHLVPRSLGGKTTFANLRLAHYSCNHDRGAGWNARHRKHQAILDTHGEPGEMPVAVCWLRALTCGNLADGKIGNSEVVIFPAGHLREP